MMCRYLREVDVDELRSNLRNKREGAFSLYADFNAVSYDVLQHNVPSFWNAESKVQLASVAAFSSDDHDHLDRRAGNDALLALQSQYAAAQVRIAALERAEVEHLDRRAGNEALLTYA